jgi:hypothetical protein
MDVHFHYRPLPIFEGLHQSTARENALIGAVGSGKTMALCADAVLHCLAQPGSRALLTRLTVPALRDTTETELVNLMSYIPEGASEGSRSLYSLCETRKEGGHIRSITLPNGSEIHLSSLDDWRKIMSRNLSWIGIDEASEIPNADTYIALLTRLRQTEPLAGAIGMGLYWSGQPRQRIVIATNPNGRDWIWDYFVNHQTTGAEVNNGTTRRYFKSTSFDNPYLYNDDGSPSAYLMSLLTMPEAWVRRYVLCEFDSFEGQILPFTGGHIHEHFTPPANWERAMGFDWGLRNPAAAVWWAKEPGTTKWHQYREWMSHNPHDSSQRQIATVLSATKVGKIIRGIEQDAREVIRWRAADPAIKNRQSETGQSVMYWLNKEGLYFTLGMKDYENRINALVELLVSDRLSVSSACPLTQLQFELYRWENLQVARGDQPERPHKKDDHLVDASQYLATIFLMSPDPKPEVKPMTFSDQVWAEQRKRNRRLAREARRGLRGGRMGNLSGMLQ